MNHSVRLWLRYELFEYGSVHWSTTTSKQLTLTSVQQLAGRLRGENKTWSVRYSSWARVSQDILLWQESEYKVFWNVLNFFHKKLLPYCDTANDSMDRDDEEHLPLHELVLFLFIHLDRHGRMKTKEALEAYNTVWHLNDSTKDTQSNSPMKAPSSPSKSPYAAGLEEKASSDAHYLGFIKKNMNDICNLLWSNKEEATFSPADVDKLGFLIVGGGNFLQPSKKLSALFPPWQPSNTAKPFLSVPWQSIVEWLGASLTVNELLYPPMGCNIPPPLLLSNTNDTDAEMTWYEAYTLQSPCRIHHVVKDTVIRTNDGLLNVQGNTDVVVTFCHDSYIYVLAPVRHVHLVGCVNSQVVVLSASGMISIDRCEKMHISAATTFLHVKNCLDCTFNVFTLQSSVFAGDNRGIQVGPCNITCHGNELAKLLEDTAFSNCEDDIGKWKDFVNVDTDQAVDVILHQPPSSFFQLVVPWFVDESCEKSTLFGLDKKYHDMLTSREVEREALRSLLQSTDLSPEIRRTVEVAIHTKFKEWLVQSGNLQQILDLVHLEQQPSE